MHSTPTTVISASALLLLLLASPASADGVRLCTTEEQDAHKPYNDKVNAPGCNTLFTFKTCTDTCLAAFEDDLRHAPNCTDGTPALSNITLFEAADVRLEICKDVREDTTDKYFPQVSPAAPKCNATQAKYQMGPAFDACDVVKNATCSDECLKIVENSITSAPVCTYDNDVFTLGESAKWVLAECLTKRKEDLKSNKVLMTVATTSGEGVPATTPPPSTTTAAPKPSTATAASAAAPTARMAAAAISVVATMVATMLG